MPFVNSRQFSLGVPLSHGEAATRLSCWCLPVAILIVESSTLRRNTKEHRIAAAMVADALIYHPSVAHFNRFVATTSKHSASNVERATALMAM